MRRSDGLDQANVKCLDTTRSSSDGWDQAAPDHPFAASEPTGQTQASRLTIQAEGSYDKVREIKTRLGVIRPEVQRVLVKLETVRVDIEPNFITAEQLLRGSD